MRYLTLFLFFISFNLMAQEKEADLMLPVSELEIEKQEEELPPTLEEVEIRQKKDRKPSEVKDEEPQQ